MPGDTDQNGMLAVFMQPDSSLDEDEFHEWYNNEQYAYDLTNADGPMRLQLPFIHTGARYRATDGLNPAWLAFYDLENVSVLSDPSYLALRDNRSEKEVKVLSAVPIRERKAGELISTKGSSSEDASVLVWVEMSLKDMGDEEELHRWYEEEHINILSKVPGWKRSRRYRLVDIDTHASMNNFLAVHEYTAENGLDDSPEIQNARSTPWRTKVFSLLRSHTRKTLERFYEFGTAPRDLLHLPSAEKVIDTHVPHNDYRLHYRLEGSISDSSPVLIFCNGLNCDLHMWDATITLLKQRFPKFRFLRYDTRGYRFEGCDKPLKLDVAASDIKALLDALLIPKAQALIGVSMGGITTVAFASRHPDRLEKFVACDFHVASDEGNEAAWDQRVQFAKDHGMEALGKQSVERWFTPKSRDSPEWNKAISMVAAASVEGMESSSKVLYNYDETENMRSIRLPGLYVAGAGDGRCTGVMKEFVAAHATNAEFREVEGAAHLPMVENVGGFVKCVEGFLRA